MKQIARIGKIKQRLQSVYFPRYQNGRIGIVLFRNKRSYNAYFKRRFPSLEVLALSHYIIAYRKIYISLDAPDFVWRHELGHALLERMRPGEMTYWLQEGTALFIQKNDFRGPVDCAKRRTASMPRMLAAQLPKLRKLKDRSPVRRINLRGPKRRVLLHPALAGYFIFYLWDRGMLFDFLRRVQANPRLSPEHVLSRGDSRFLKKLLEGFRSWLKTEKPAKSLPGC